ncbi:MAG TPA: glutaredoxin 3 [Gammaproteobacteria bacterium]|nr:glutaredoxin 3 [Gammaproteobacteria bacterium]
MECLWLEFSVFPLYRPPTFHISDSKNIMQQLSAFFVTNWPLLLALIIILFMLVRSYVGPGASRPVSPMELLQLINHQNALVLDVRTDKEYRDGHIINSMHIPLSTLSDQLSKLAAYKHASVVIVCRSGARSAQAAGTLRKAGFEQVHNLAGGVMAWQNANMPLTTEKGKPPKPATDEPTDKEADKKKTKARKKAKEQEETKAIGQDAPADEHAPPEETVRTEETTHSPEITIYTAAHCPFCVRAIQLLKDKGVAYSEIDVGGKPELRQEMAQKAGADSVPQIFVDDKHIGDCDGIHALDAQGKLDELLANGQS